MKRIIVQLYDNYIGRAEFDLSYLLWYVCYCNNRALLITHTFYQPLKCLVHQEPTSIWIGTEISHFSIDLIRQNANINVTTKEYIIVTWWWGQYQVYCLRRRELWPDEKQMVIFYVKGNFNFAIAREPFYKYFTVIITTSVCKRKPRGIYRS